MQIHIDISWKNKPASSRGLISGQFAFLASLNLCPCPHTTQHALTMSLGDLHQLSHCWASISNQGYFQSRRNDHIDQLALWECFIKLIIKMMMKYILKVDAVIIVVKYVL